MEQPFKQLHSLRKSRKLKQEDVAKMAGISREAYLRAESGRADPRLSTLMAVAANALVIAGYSLADGQGGRQSGQPIAYTLWVMVFVGLAFLPVALYYRGVGFVRDLRHEWRFALSGGGASTLAYGIVIWAMSHAPIGLVSATRETSALFASVMGAVLLKEKFGLSRYVAAGLVVGGLAVMRLA
jgi:drug/metabolite transporter (DMT)-like permease